MARKQGLKMLVSSATDQNGNVGIELASVKNVTKVISISKSIRARDESSRLHVARERNAKRAPHHGKLAKAVGAADVRLSQKLKDTKSVPDIGKVTSVVGADSARENDATRAIDHVKMAIPMHLEDLPDTVLDIVLAKMTIGSLVRLRATSKKWNSIVKNYQRWQWDKRMKEYLHTSTNDMDECQRKDSMKGSSELSQSK